MASPEPAVHAPSRHLLSCIALICTGLLLFGWYAWSSGMIETAPPLWRAFSGGMIAAAATALGTVPIWFASHIPPKWHDTLLGFGAGVMLAACSFSLLMPALNMLSDARASVLHTSIVMGGSVGIGAGLLLLIERHVPHEHFIKGLERQQASSLKRAWLFTFAIALHNVPEGLAIGVAHAGPDAANATALTAGIALQDAPEGLVVALALRGVGYARSTSALLGAASGLTEPLAALLGAMLVGFSGSFLPWGLAMAAGAMLFVISHEVIPESHRQGHEAHATCGLMTGFVLMMILDTQLSAN